jgi:hypothetical protein
VLAIWLLFGLGGCKTPSADNKYPNDPLLISQKPIERTPDTAQPAVVAQREPPVPAEPTDDLATAFPGDGPAAKAEGNRKDLSVRNDWPRITQVTYP